MGSNIKWKGIIPLKRKKEKRKKKKGEQTLCVTP